MKEIIITHVTSIIVLIIYCFVTVKFFGKNFPKKDIIPELKIPKNISAIGVAFFNNLLAQKIFHIGIFSLVEKNFIITEIKPISVIKNLNIQILYKKNLEKSESNYYRQNELFSEEKWILDSLSNSENDIFYDFKNGENPEEKREKYIDNKKEFFLKILGIVLLILSFLADIFSNGSSDSSTDDSDIRPSNDSADTKNLDPLFSKMIEIYKKVKKKFEGSFWSPEKSEEFILYRKNFRFYIFYFTIIIISIILTSKEIEFLNRKINFGLIVLVCVVVFFIQFFLFLTSLSIIRSRYNSLTEKTIFSFILLFFIWIFAIFDITFLFTLNFYILIPFAYVILFLIYKKAIVQYTENGLLVMNEIEPFRRYILNYEKLEIPIFHSENELIENFFQMYIYAFALGLEKKFLNLLNDIMKKNSFTDKKEFIYKKLYISTVFYDKELISKLQPKIRRQTI